MFDERKVAQAAAYFLDRRGGRMSHLKLMKLLYLADREALRRYGMSISGDEYSSLPHGPVLTRTKELMDGYCKPVSGGWESWISDKENHEVELRHEANRDLLDELSNADIAVLNHIWSDFGKMTRWEIRDYTHDKRNVPEWEDPNGSSRPIRLDAILRAVGKTHKQIKEDLEQEESRQYLDSLFQQLSQ
ncbi:Panacea domain-containing protein [Vogesella sp. AC12]|uniref:Panacea domain-containing protein n=1 Tax=Vogesella sp. AC12 TaxID=2950550 RepID=UPI00210C2F35|nr:Panacea domain-containing protein [Vogesella sp. AC12]MCQ4145634.1 Panacea domain-containing protein [Vogesella sp. AC12]